MRKFDEVGQSLCKQQAQFFVESVDRFEGSSYMLIKTFMQSKVARKIDETNQFDVSEVIEELEQYSSVGLGNIKISKDVIYWIGYIYRYWAYVYEMTSKKILSIAGSITMESLYNPYHTLDPEIAIERIMDDCEYSMVKDSSLDLLKRIYGMNK